ncbi:UDP-N-acetylmuramoyl-L-alanine--D-glutamate ligase [Erythrobacter sp. HL-111]|uniref:UDP-N-acetylmuramoyl-L-alanine--D-glutamate ligase n=1 Tax=Erythrobacter sp. HL-111 TaxID=1798193 RepID=UPI0006DA4AEC|nr:UDP-N-acetylmuramoyl-L-alanine--D-glutamate ligase [Erythrobacter sp. HL-111]KPP90459.1 MAG: UDP-N-acetylmuramoylalanine--D-glutamate ligase MurD [Erythrobacteraceae bacterium HL-111]SDT13209.1 UDP-N-acetylmuramoylalanine--D-glutamate ligase [Erythrobacter sp. HL-111]
MITSSAFAGKRYAVLGLARSGAASVRALLASGAEVIAWDRDDDKRSAFEGRCDLADPLALDLTGFDGIVVSPGVPLNTHPIAPHAARYGVPVIGDVELFALARRDLLDHRVVGITGTNGKSTVTALTHHILAMAGFPAAMGGNIGEPIMSREPLAPNETGVGVYVLELSSFQIDLTFSLDPEVAALTNITPDHLDRYADYPAYAAAKERLFEMQSARHLAVFGTDEGPAGAIRARQAERRGEGRAVLADLARFAHLQHEWPALQGPHNLQNVAVAVALAEELGVTEPQWRHALPRFRGLPHRMERTCEKDGIVWINDSKATNPASAAPALAAFPPDPSINRGAARIHWIVGGLAKENGLAECEAHLPNIAAAYTVGEAGPRFADLLEARGLRVERCELIAEAVSRAGAAVRPGEVVLLSPACASYDQFRDYEKRGEHFRNLARVISGCADCPPGSFAGGAGAGA